MTWKEEVKKLSEEWEEAVSEGDFPKANYLSRKMGEIVEKNDKPQMVVEVFERDMREFAYNPELAKKFVWNHRNVFGDSYRFIESSDPPVIREISISPDGKMKYFWFWVFFPNKYIVFSFKYKPSKKELEKMWEKIREFKNEKK